MSIFARLIAHVASRQGCLRSVVVPRALPGAFVDSLLREADNIFEGPDEDGNPQAIHVTRRPDETHFSVDPREIVKYRAKTRLFVWVESEYEPDTSMAGAIASIVGPGYPDRGSGTMSFGEVADAFERVKQGAFDALLPGEHGQSFKAAIAYCLEFMARGFEAIGNGKSTWMSAWWVATDFFLEELGEALDGASRGSPLFGTATVFALAGLPRPADDKTGRYEHLTPEVYADIVRACFGNDDSVESTLAWLAFKDPGCQLGNLDWASWGMKKALLGHIGATLCTLGTQVARGNAWSSIAEDIFEGLSAVFDSGADIAIFEDHREAFSPLSGLYIIDPSRIGTAFLDNGEMEASVNIQARIPWYASGGLVSQTPPACNIKLSPKSRCSFTTHSRKADADGLLVDGVLKLKIKPGKRWPVRLFMVSVEASGGGLLNSNATCQVAIPPSWEPSLIALYSKGVGAFIMSKGGELRSKDESGHFKSIDPIKLTLDAEVDCSFYICSPHKGSEYKIADAENGSSTVMSPERIQGHSNFWSAGRKRLKDGDEYWLEDAGARTLYLEVEVIAKEGRPFLPLHATCLGTIPSLAPLPDMREEDIRAWVEERWLKGMRGGEASRGGIYQVFATDSSAPGNNSTYPASLDVVDWHSWPNDGSPLSLGRAADGPTAEFKASAEFKELLDALDDIRASLGESIEGLMPSRWQLRDVSEGAIERYLNAFRALVGKGKASGDRDHFWANYPFSVIVFNPSVEKVEAILLSPLHPLRLGWLFGAERSIVESLIPGNPDRTALAMMLEGWNFPAMGLALGMGGPSMLVAVPIDPGWHQLFIGWSALAHVESPGGSLPLLPAFAGDWRLPAGASSGLNGGGIGAAIKDYLHVYPYASLLTFDLYSARRAPRSREMDQSVVSEIARVSSGDPDGAMTPLAIRIRDNDNRLGDLPDRDTIAELLGSTTSDGWLPFEWSKYPAAIANTIAADIRFVEDGQALVSSASSDATALGQMGKWPTRRFSRRTMDQGMLNICPHVQQGIGWSAYGDALRQMETWGTRDFPAILVNANLSHLGASSASKWIVTGNVLVDPISLVDKMAHGQGLGRILWEWRPAYLPRGAKDHGLINFGRRPYVTLASIPQALRDKLGSLQGLPDGGGAELVLQTLGLRGIGLSSLPASGPNHALGALGFYWGFKVFDAARQSVAGDSDHAYLPMPIDAAQGLISSIAASGQAKAPRADILGLYLESVSGKVKLTFHPIEIRCTGFSTGNPGTPFPSQTSREVAYKLSQLDSSRDDCRAMVAAVVDGGASLQRAALAALIEASGQTSFENEKQQLQLSVIGAILDGTCQYSLAPGLLLWIQKATGVSQHFVDPDNGGNGILFFDPTDVDGGFWARGGTAANAVESCLAIAESIEPRTKSHHDEGETPGGTGSCRMTGAAVATKKSSDALPERPARSQTEERGAQGVGTLDEPIENPPPVEEDKTTDIPVPVPEEKDWSGNDDPRIRLGQRYGMQEIVIWSPKHASKPLANCHMAILGGSGSGKTQSLLSIVSQLGDCGVPAVIFDFRDDYCRPEIIDALGSTLYDIGEGIPVNPLSLVGDALSGKVNTFNQAYMLKGIFKDVFGLGDIQAEKLRRAVMRLYDEAGIANGSAWASIKGREPPFEDLEKAIADEGDDNLSARMSSLFDLRIFGKAPGNLDELLRKPIVLRLTTLPSEELKKAVGGIVLMSIYQSLLRQGQTQRMRVAIVIDEAHRVANLEPVRLLIKEARPYGAAVLLSTQEARDFDATIFSNVSTLLSFRLNEPAECKRVSELLVGLVEQRKAMAEKLRRLDIFCGVLRNGHYESGVEVRVDPFFERQANRPGKAMSR